MIEDQSWTARGACVDACPDDLFVEGAAQRAVVDLCAGCPVQLDCLVDALDHKVLFGVWGGMTERQRRALLRSRPDVTSWRAEIEADPTLVPDPGYRPRPVPGRSWSR
ncbi:WhiB family transcriptional regulator [Cellulomonas bogoriensis]|uniref:Transcriptional regulator WhiB n=1 Tax=Cellulomonas bogoriensis 69B4 = DSM 16987 TaxID=1386082 RepID=A0A0A0BZQ2_9CELL|nr:WhiB family transcriptional regulator [Cellulomonas bogoriensis]KGM13868.1 transcriptional regulator [Cellulomonas bogoriensis 69B4 = DSM 16987]